jgi:hypothetical protein
MSEVNQSEVNQSFDDEDVQVDMSVRQYTNASRASIAPTDPFTPLAAGNVVDDNVATPGGQAGEHASVSDMAMAARQLQQGVQQSLAAASTEGTGTATQSATVTMDRQLLDIIMHSSHQQAELAKRQIELVEKQTELAMLQAVQQAERVQREIAEEQRKVEQHKWMGEDVERKRQHDAASSRDAINSAGLKESVSRLKAWASLDKPRPSFREFLEWTQGLERALLVLEPHVRVAAMSDLLTRVNMCRKESQRCFVWRTEK